MSLPTSRLTTKESYRDGAPAAAPRPALPGRLGGSKLSDSGTQRAGGVPVLAGFGRLASTKRIDLRRGVPAVALRFPRIASLAAPSPRPPRRHGCRADPNDHVLPLQSQSRDRPVSSLSRADASCPMHCRHAMCDGRSAASSIPRHRHRCMKLPNRAVPKGTLRRFRPQRAARGPNPASNQMLSWVSG
jgi:hypothetical protein